jgi:hypothetical protein
VVPCKALLDGAVTRGAKVEMQIYPGAYHHFDWPNLPRRELPLPTAGGAVWVRGNGYGSATGCILPRSILPRPLPDELS